MKRILHIEDDRDIAEVVKIILELVGHEVHSAYTGEEGMKLIHENEYDLVIFDIMLPDTSGIEIYDKMVNSQKNKNHKCIFLSILSIPSKKKEEMSKKSVVRFLPKPFKKADLIKNVAELLAEDEDTNSSKP